MWLRKFIEQNLFNIIIASGAKDETEGLILSACEASSTCIWEGVREQKFLKMVVENFRQRNLYFIFNFKFKSAMNRPGPARRDALCHAFQKTISQVLFPLAQC